MQPIHELETPSVLIDLDRMERNIAAMQTRCDDAGVKFRPHIKTHKIPQIAKMQLEAGAVGIACQKVSEAQVFAEAGIHDLMIPYNVVGAAKTRKLADLAYYTRLIASLDSEHTLKGYSAAAQNMEIVLRVVIELATEMQRAGASVSDALRLAEIIDQDDHLHFGGLLIYPSMPAARPVLQEALDGLHRRGIGVDIVSGGGIGASHHLKDVPELTEIRVGTYVFNDWTTVDNGYATLDECAMTVRSTVVSAPTYNRVILDCGSKTLSSEVHNGAYGFIMEYPQARIYKLNEEHAYVDISACDEKRPEIGEIVQVVPVHTCVVTNLHDTLYGVRGDQVESTFAVAARGKVW
jgi:D-serine deaminase-like pyridoxal phosphate-dependent protein